MWELDYLTSRGELRPEVAVMLTELLAAESQESAYHAMERVEAAVAPLSGRLAEDAPAVVTAVVAGILHMHPAARSEALLLLSGICGSVRTVDSRAAVESGRRLEAALPALAAVIEEGTSADIAQGIDLLSLSSSLSVEAADRARFYLTRIASSTTGAVKASAELELTQI
jgi:hypothetical protein